MNLATPAAKRLIGYSDELSVRSGERIAFYVSGEMDGSYAFEIHRLLGGGFAPEGPPLRTERLTTAEHHPILHQAIAPGSFGIAKLREGASSEFSDGFTIVVGVQPTATGTPQSLVQLRGETASAELGLNAEGRVVLTAGSERIVGEFVPCGSTSWSVIVASSGPEGLSIAVRSIDRFIAATSLTPGPLLEDLNEVLIGAAFDGAQRERHFSGRIERPIVLKGVFEPNSAAELAGVSGGPIADEALLAWEFSESIGTWSVPGHGALATDLTLFGAPKRAAAGSSWAGATDWQQHPTQFGAILFYPDALEDCGWASQTSWIVPENVRSGFYAAHLMSGSDEDWIPFFVRPRIGEPAAEVLFVASSATYFAYANSRFWWEDPIQEIAQDRLVELGPDEQYLLNHPELGLSNYDLHADGSPVVFSSRRRPNLFMRPGHSRGESYASDLYLVAWLEHLGIAYDVITDEDLHFDGSGVLDGYRVAISGSHPEYLSIAMHDTIRDWVLSGGRYIYVGGNGFTSCVTWGTERPWLMENRSTGRMRVDTERTRAEAVNQIDGQLGSDMGESGRSPGSLFGVDSVTMGFDRSYPVVRSEASYAPEFSFAFAGIHHRLFGGRSLSGGGVIGQEWDNARLTAGTPGLHVLASSIDHSLIPDILGADPVHHGDVVVFFHDRGAVLSASAMAWAGALHVNHYDNDAETFMRNFLTRFLDPAPLAQPSADKTRKSDVSK